MPVCGVNLYDSVESQLLTFGGCLSIFCLGTIFFLVYGINIPNLRRHPINIIIRKSVFELLFVSQFLYMAFVPKSFFWLTVQDDDDNPCNTNPIIWPLSWLTQFSLLGGELWFWVLSVDIHVALTNPFSNNIANSMFYTIIVLGTAAVTATILVSVTPVQYGLSSDPMIWVKDQKAGSTNWMKVCMFYLFLPFIYLYCGGIAVFARWQINRGLEATLEKRYYSVRKQTVYVIGYMLFWTCVYTFQFALWVQQVTNSYQLNNNVEVNFQTISGFLLASRGIWSLGAFLVANWPAILAYIRNEQQKTLFYGNNSYNSPPKEEEEQVQLNIALQREIVNFTAHGIQRAVRDMDLLLLKSSVSSNSRYSSFNLFNVKMPGEFVTFLVGDQQSQSRHSQQRLILSLDEQEQKQLQMADKHNQRAFTASDDRNFSLEAENPMMANSFARASMPLSSSDTFARTSDRSHKKVTEDYVAYNMEPQATLSTQQQQQAAAAAAAAGGNEGQQQQNSGDAMGSKPAMQRRETIVQKLANRIIPARNSFQFTDYSPRRFAHLRTLAGVATDSYLVSFNSTTMPSFSEGKSGAFLYFSSDGKYIVKTTTEKEFEKLLNMLPSYEEYIASEFHLGRNSLITRYLGAHRIVMYDIPLYFVVMKNVCPIVDEKYDLKGSWVNRHGSKKTKDPVKVRPKKHPTTPLPITPEEYGNMDLRQTMEEKESTPLFLDNDVKTSFMMHPEDAVQLAAQIARDTKFLESFNLMDYSLLIGVKRKTFMVHSRSNSRSSAVSGSVSVNSQLQDSIARSMSTLSENNRVSFANSRPSLVNAGGGGGGGVSPVPTSSPMMTTEGLDDHNNHVYLAAAVEGAGQFYFGLIDILQEWNWRKWQERTFKVNILQKDGSGLSAIEPVAYRKRFMQRAVLDVLSGVDEIPGDETFRCSTIERPRNSSLVNRYDINQNESSIDGDRNNNV